MVQICCQILHNYPVQMAVESSIRTSSFYIYSKKTHISAHVQISLYTKIDSCMAAVKYNEQEYSAAKRCVVWDSTTFSDLGAQFCVCFVNM